MKLLFLTGLVVFGLTSGCGLKNAGAEPAASLDELNRALTVLTMHSGAFPPATNELAAFLKMSGKSMPQPPPGKRLVLDPNTHQFVLLEQ